MRLLLRIAVIGLLTPATLTLAQTNPPATNDNPYSTFNKAVYAHVKDYLLRSADKMTEENYSFKPTDSVRSFGQIIGHIADAQYMFCSMSLGEKNPGLKIEQTKTSKADLSAALKDSFTYCEKAYNAMTDTAGTQTVKMMGMDAPKLDVLTVNMMHDMEHYGNLVTYMRLKNIVPPSTEAAQSQQQQNQPKK